MDLFEPSRHTTIQLHHTTPFANPQHPTSTANNLARSRAGHVGALGALLATSETDTRPLPARAGALAAENVDGSSLGADGTLNIVDGQASDRDAGSRLAGRRAVLVVLLDHDSVLGDLRVWLLVS